ncbi:MAG: ATP-binding cassette domain-containing protein, partial [Chlamydiota bacterium]
MLLLDVKDLQKAYGQKQILNNLSFSVNKGEVVGLLGPNGAGKTTAFYLTMGLIKPDSGQIFFNSEDITHLPIHKRSHKG